MTITTAVAPQDSEWTARRVAMPAIAIGIFTLGAVFLQRLGIRLNLGGAEYGFPLSLLVTPLVIAWLIAAGWSKVSPIRLGLYCLVIIAAMMSTLLSDGPISVFSMYLFVGMYVVFLFPVMLGEEAFLRYFRMVANVAAVICCIGAATYALQFVIKTNLWFTWRDVIPKQYLIEFNSLAYTAWGSGIYKANGFFLMEASWLSQLAARVLLVSIFILKDWRYIIPCGLGLLTAYSGTGIILFALFGALPLLLLMLRNKATVGLLSIGLIFVPLVLILFADDLNLDLFVRRLNEFNNPYTSGYIRFITSQMAVGDFLKNDFLTILFGAGPGMQDVYVRSYVGDGFMPGWAKLFIEYGAFGLIAFGSFLFYCIFSTTRTLWIAAAITFQYLYLDGSLVQPQQAFLTLWICGLVMLDRNQTGAPQPAFSLLARRT